MFLNQNQLAREIVSISRTAVTVAGKPADQHDRNQFLSVTLLRYGLEADLLGHSCLGECLYRRVVHQLVAVDLQYYAEDYKELKMSFLALWQVSPEEFPWREFKRRVSGKIHYKWTLVVLEKMVASSPAAALQWLAFDERLLLTTNKDDISKEIDAYVSFEEDLSGRSYPEDLTDHLSLILSDWLSEFSLGEALPDPTFGPGAVAEWSGRLPQLSKALRCVYDADTVDKLCEFYYCDVDDLIVGKPGKASFQNRIIFVPKNALKHRIISAEPCWLSWLQQGIKRPLYDYVEKHPKMFTWFSDQAKSRELARKGSIDGRYATIDFSSASDAVTKTLVQAVYKRTWIVDPLLLTRSTTALLPDGRIISLEKFAPMGSATCFVTMDLLFLSICELAIRTALGRPGAVGDYVVYGDDVIIRQDAVQQFLNMCDQLGLRVNADKTYCDPTTPHLYREACGIEAMDGADVTPLRYSRFQEPILASGPVDVTWWTSMISLMNRCLVEYHYDQTRSVLVECIKRSIARGDARKRELARSIWEHALRIDRSDYLEGFDGPLAVVVPDGTATNYHCKAGSDWDESNKAKPSYQRNYVLVRAPSLRPVSVRKVVEDAANNGDLEPLRAALHLWDFKAQSRRPTEADNLWHQALKFTLKPGDKYLDYLAGCEGPDTTESLLTSVAGVQALKWVWTRYYP
jgi:hypothetical protein